MKARLATNTANKNTNGRSLRQDALIIFMTPAIGVSLYETEWKYAPKSGYRQAKLYETSRRIRLGPTAEHGSTPAHRKTKRMGW